jgi:CubicO group peptidase (beta-lactamase class C family)
LWGSLTQTHLEAMFDLITGPNRASARRDRIALGLIIGLGLGLLAPRAPAFGQALPAANPESVGLSSERLARVTDALQAHIDAGHIAGVVAAVVRNERLVYMEALGQADIEAARPMPEDAIFRLYSMTRSITSLAAMILWEEGAFRLDDPVSRYLPQFSDQRVFSDAGSPDVDRTEARNGDITVEHLLLHTSGLGSRSSSIYRSEGVRLRTISVHEMVDNAARTPLFEDPGTNWRYGISTTILGRLVEVWSGKPLESYLQERVFEPLGMTDTGFWVEPERADRLATVYRPSPEGELRPYQIEEVPFTEPPVLIEGGVGLVSSTMDFLRFSQMFLNGGELDGNRVLQPETVAMMTVNRIPDALLPIGFGRPTLGQGWGLGFSIVMDASQYAYPVNDGDFWWDGSAGTRFWIDPTENMVTIIMAQVSPSRGGGFREEFKTGVYEAIIEKR